MKEFKLIINTFLRRNRSSYLLLTSLMFLSEGSLIFLFDRMGSFLEKALSASTADFEWMSASLFVLGLSFIPITLGFLIKHFDFTLSNRGLIYVEGEILDNLMHTDYRTLMDYDKTRLAQQINNDCVTVLDYRISKLPSFVVTVFKLVVILLVFSVYSGFVSLVLLCISLLFVFLYLGCQKKYEELDHEMISAQSEYFRVLGGELLSVFLVKVNSWYERTSEKFNSAGSVFVTKSVRFLDFDFLLTNLARSFSIVCTLILPAILLLTGSRQVAGLFTAVTLIQLYFPALEETMELFKVRSQYLVAQKRLSHILELPKEVWGKDTVPRILSLASNEMTFRYEKDPAPILRNLNLSFEPGNIYLVTGHNGSGKSTFLNLLLGLLDPSCGSIQINGSSLRRYDLKALRSEKISFCEQQPYLVEGTIFENLDYGQKESDPSVLNNPLLDFVHRLPRGFDTEISFDASNLSGGQRQRIALSRCFSKTSADLMIFDEPTSALDKEGIDIFLTLLQTYKRNRIVLVVTHDPKLTEIADRVLDLSQKK